MYQQVLDFWFKEITPTQWWQKDLAFDGVIKQRFGQLHQQAHCGELYQWRRNADSSLAEIIILDQFSRNIFRDTPLAFASDPLALALAQQAIEKGFDRQLAENYRSFLYMPFMHSESSLIHQEAVKLFQSLTDHANLSFELQHKAIIDRFGRYPHRNSILSRASTDEELAFLQQPNSSF